MTSIPPGAKCIADGCSRKAVDPDHPGGLCFEHVPGEAEPAKGQSPDQATVAGPGTRTDISDKWDTADFAAPEPDTWPTPHINRGQWMARKVGNKAPWAPWADDDAPVGCSHEDHTKTTTCSECSHSAAYKWGSEGSGTYVHADAETARQWAEKHPRCNGDLAYIQRADSSLAFVDGDDVRCSETGEVHPVFRALLEHLGLTYADISTSGSGVHAVYRGEIPVEDGGQAVVQIDSEPWGTNDTPPSIEVYANKHVCVMTGDHVPGTPTEARSWDADALRAFLQAHGYEDQPDSQVAHDTDTERDSLADYDPDVTSARDTTDDIRDVFVAVDRLEPGDMRLQTHKTGTDATGWATWDPAYRPSESGASLHYNGDGVFHDHKHNEAFGVLALVAAEEDIISDPWDRLRGGDWWEAVEAARNRGADIPEVSERVTTTQADAEPIAVLPESDRVDDATSGWDWRHTAGNAGSSTLSMDDARERTAEAITDAYERGDRVLIEALPTLGKSYGAVKAAADTGEPVTILTGRGRKEQYRQFREWCKKHGLDYHELPSFTQDCPTAAGEHGEEQRERTMDLYRRGATPQEIHNLAEHYIGEPLPCQVGETDERVDCPHRHVWNFDPDEYDILIGHYTHAHTEVATSGRVVVCDEFPESYERGLGPATQGAMSYWLGRTDSVPYEDATDLLENRDDQDRRGQALLWFEEHGVEPDEALVFEDAQADARAPLAVYTILAGEDLGNGIERATFGDNGIGIYNRETTEVWLLQPPELEYATGIVALDGTPIKRMWELTLGEQLNHREVLQGNERAEYIGEALNLNLVRVGDHIKPYNSPDHVNVKSDAALFQRIRETHDQRPAVITTATAEKGYEDTGVLSDVAETEHYGNVLGSNKFADTRLGAVVGSNHYGDHFLKRWGGYAGEATVREGKGSDLRYTGFGDDILHHMREHETLQAAMRFGRDGGGAVVYVHTDTLPEWVPLAGEGRVVSAWSDGMKSVLRALNGLDAPTTAEVAAHPAVEVGHRQVFEHLETLREREYLTREQDPDDGRRVCWQGEEVHRVNDHGYVEMEPVELDTLKDGEVADLARSTVYTWEFRDLAQKELIRPGGGASRGHAPAAQGLDRGDPPPDGAD